MCFDIAVTKMQAESKQRDSEDPGESVTLAVRDGGKKVERRGLKTVEGRIDRGRCREREGRI